MGKGIRFQCHLKSLYLLLGIVTGCLVIASAAPAQVYQWVDEDGVKHFSNTPPPEGASDVRQYEEEKSSAAPESAQQPQAETPPADQPVVETEGEESVEEETGSEGEIADEAPSSADTEENPESEADNPDITAVGPTDEQELIEQERDRLEIEITRLNRQLEEAQTARDRGSSDDAGQWNERIEQIQSEIEKEKSRSAVRIEEIRGKKGLQQ